MAGTLSRGIRRHPASDGPKAAFFLPRSEAQEGNGTSARKREGFRSTHEWKMLLPLFEWPEQEDYETIRLLVLLDLARVFRVFLGPVWALSTRSASVLRAAERSGGSPRSRVRCPR